MIKLLFLLIPFLFNSQNFPIPKGFKSELKTIDGVRLHYVKGGQGPLIFLIHGFGSTWYEWHDLMGKFKKEFKLVAVDLPGLGNSEKPKSFIAKDVSILLYKLAKMNSDGQKFIIIAHDIGIWCSFPMILQHQEEIKSVIYLEAPILDDDIYTFPSFTKKGESATWHFSFFTAENDLAEKLILGKEKEFLGYFIKKQAINKSVFNKKLINLYTQSYSRPGVLNSSFKYYKYINKNISDNKILLSDMKIKIPILTVGGDGSMGNFQNNQIKKYATNTNSKIMYKCGHWLPEECSDQLEEVILNFISDF